MSYLFSLVAFPSACFCFGSCVGFLEAFVQTLFVDDEGNNAEPLQGFVYMVVSTLPWFVGAVSMHFVEKTALHVVSTKRLMQLLLLCFAAFINFGSQISRAMPLRVLPAYTVMHLLASVIFGLLISTINGHLRNEARWSGQAFAWGIIMKAYSLGVSTGSIVVTGLAAYQVPLAFLTLMSTPAVTALLILSCKRAIPVEIGVDVKKSDGDDDDVVETIVRNTHAITENGETLEAHTRNRSLWESESRNGTPSGGGDGVGAAAEDNATSSTNDVRKRRKAKREENLDGDDRDHDVLAPPMSIEYMNNENSKRDENKNNITNSTVTENRVDEVRSSANDAEDNTNKGKDDRSVNSSINNKENKEDCSRSSAQDNVDHNDDNKSRNNNENLHSQNLTNVDDFDDDDEGDEGHNNNTISSSSNSEDSNDSNNTNSSHNADSNDEQNAVVKYRSSNNKMTSTKSRTMSRHVPPLALSAKLGHIGRTSGVFLLYMVVRRVPELIASWEFAPLLLPSLGLHPLYALLGFTFASYTVAMVGVAAAAVLASPPTLSSNLKRSATASTLCLLYFVALTFGTLPAGVMATLAPVAIIGNQILGGLETPLFLLYFLRVNAELPAAMRLTHIGTLAAAERLASYVLYPAVGTLIALAGLRSGALTLAGAMLLVAIVVVRLK